VGVAEGPVVGVLVRVAVRVGVDEGPVVGVLVRVAVRVGVDEGPVVGVFVRVAVRVAVAEGPVVGVLPPPGVQYPMISHPFDEPSVLGSWPEVLHLARHSLPLWLTWSPAWYTIDVVQAGAVQAGGGVGVGVGDVPNQTSEQE